MPVSVACTSCGSRLKAPDQLAGRTLKCPKCSAPIAVPAAQPPRPPQPPPFRQAPPAVMAPVEIVPAEFVIVPPPNPAATTRPCPFCGETIQDVAKKCRFCGEILDPVLRAAEESKRTAEESRRTAAQQQQARRRDGGDGYRPAPRPRRSLIGGCLGLCLVMGGIGVIAVLLLTWKQREAVNEAHKLWDAGNRDEAVAKYKEGYPSAGDQQGPVLKRIVEYELARGDMQEAKAWVEKGVDGNVNAGYEHPNAVSMAAIAQQDRQAKAAREQEAREAQAKERDERVRQKDAAIPLVTARQIYQAYKDNPVAGDRDFKGKIVKVRGTVVDINRAFGSMYILLDTDSPLFTVQCVFGAKHTDELASLRKGEDVTVRGKCDGKVGNVFIRNCSFVR